MVDIKTKGYFPFKKKTLRNLVTFQQNAEFEPVKQNTSLISPILGEALHLLIQWKHRHCSIFRTYGDIVET